MLNKRCKFTVVICMLMMIGLLLFSTSTSAMYSVGEVVDIPGFRKRFLLFKLFNRF